ncbi:MAG: allantoicase [Gammaproteobacteria bacterium]|nr:allantoicase [Gammaproteobacteria bacterium]NKB62762.1 allantoicase [Gammaproteobacteria bacterium]
MKDFSTRWVNLTSAKLGAQALACSDDFFAPMERMLHDQAPVFIEDKYDDNGKWMDGWESRRKRIAGHDWCIVKMARPGAIHGVEIDTAHFTGNYAPAASLEACFYEGDDSDLNNASDIQWTELISKTELDGNNYHQYEIEDNRIYTHLRLHIYPDGGIARLKVYGSPTVDWSRILPGELVDIAAALNGGVALACNNEHFGTMRNLLTPGRGVNMGDGWETRRRREPGNDWVVIALAHPGVIKTIDIDTAHFKGNYPDRCSIQGINTNQVNLDTIDSDSQSWPTLLPEVKLAADTEHVFKEEVIGIGPVSHIRLNIYPDGGISRLHLFAEILGQT